MSHQEKIAKLSELILSAREKVKSIYKCLYKRTEVPSEARGALEELQCCIDLLCDIENDCLPIGSAEEPKGEGLREVRMKAFRAILAEAELIKEKSDKDGYGIKYMEAVEMSVSAYRAACGKFED